MITSKSIKIVLSLSFSICTLVTFAQGAPPATPIDGGLSMLLVAGGAYGFHKIRSIKKKS